MEETLMDRSNVEQRMEQSVSPGTIQADHVSGMDELREYVAVPVSKTTSLGWLLVSRAASGR
jgi:hypothetical protein